jgi:hypothetical protein
MTEVATHIVFEAIYPRGTVTVPLNEAAAFQEAHAGSHRMEKVIWDDGGWSWGKLWYFGGTNKVCRIGAGAYGDCIVWEHSISPYNTKALREAGVLPMAEAA